MKSQKSWRIWVMSDNRQIRHYSLSKIMVCSLSIILIIFVLSVGMMIYFINLLSDRNQALRISLSDTQQQLEQYDEDRHVIENQLAELRLLESEFLDLIATLNPERIAQYSDGPQGGVDTESAKSGIVKSSTLDPISGRDLSEIKGEIPQLVASYKTAVKQISNVKEDLKQTPVDWPADTDVVTSEFGYRSDPFTSTESFHSGIDLAGPLGTEIYATGDGVVEIAGHEGSYGQSILINHRDSYQTRYSHLSRILVSRGDKVKQGQLIGLMGSTGRSTGVHLHYEIIKDGERVDPYPFMTFIQRALHE